MTYIFDGKAFAQKKEENLGLRVSDLAKNGIVPTLVSFIVGEDPASHLYVSLKKKAAERIGAKLLIVNFDHDLEKGIIIKKIKEFNDDTKVHGIMVQLPLPRNFSREERDEILNTISPIKDVDGLRSDSKFIAPTAKAVLEVFRELVKGNQFEDKIKICVLGASGFEGSQIVKAIETENMNVEISKVNSKTSNLQPITNRSDVVISVTGVPGLVQADMVKEGSILIDVGSPQGDIEKSAYEKASFVSPVPGGVGPVTISCLLENLVHSAIT